MMRLMQLSISLLLIAASFGSGYAQPCSSVVKRKLFEIKTKIDDGSYTQRSLSSARNALQKALSQCPSATKGFHVEMYGFISRVDMDILANDLEQLKNDVRRPIPHWPGDVYFTPLEYAANYGTVAALSQLVRYGIHVNATDSRGNTALLGAVESPIESFQKVKILIKAGAHPNVRGYKMPTPLGSAILHGKFKTAHYLVEHGGCASFGAYKIKPSELKRASKALHRDVKTLTCRLRNTTVEN
jgi:hypothetical protein